MSEEVSRREHLLGDALRRVLIRAGVIRAEACCTGPELLLAAEDYAGSDPRRNEEAACVRSLSDEGLLQALKNVGCDLSCDACAEVFFTGARMREHTCPNGR